MSLTFTRKGQPRRESTLKPSEYPGTWRQGWLNALSPEGEKRLSQIYLRQWIRWVNRLGREPEYLACSTAELKEQQDAILEEVRELRQRYREGGPEMTEAEWWPIREKLTRREAVMQAITFELERRSRMERLGLPHAGAISARGSTTSTFPTVTATPDPFQWE